MAITEHSMCQPGRPVPISVSHEGSPWLRRFPEREIASIGLFVGVDIDARASDHTVEIVMRKLAVAGKSRDAEVDRAVAAVGVAFLLELVNRGGHFGDVLGRARDAFGAFKAQHRAIVEKRFGVGFGVIGERLALRDRIANDLVVHVRDVHDVIEFVTVEPEHATQQIVEDEGAEITDVRVIVNRRAAGIHSHGIALDRREWLDLLCQRVVEAQGHLYGGKFYGISACQGRQCAGAPTWHERGSGAWLPQSLRG